MVQAILAGRKTQTRRVINPQPNEEGLWNHTDFPMALDSTLEGWWGETEEGESREFKPKCQVGDFLWVRETFINEADLGEPPIWVHKANNENYPRTSGCSWKPSIHMPKAAARIWLRCTGVRAERVQDITEKDAIAEGIERVRPEGMLAFKSYAVHWDACVFPYSSFRTLWQSINSEPPKPGKVDGRWEANPWVWVYSFEVVSTTGKDGMRPAFPSGATDAVDAWSFMAKSCKRVSGALKDAAVNAVAAGEALHKLTKSAPEELPCYHCQGGGCTACNGYGTVPA
jgi:hypothetical protein